jgi:hypothetical protein
MKIHRPTAAALVGFVLVIVALATWGHHLGMSAEALSWTQSAAALIGMLVMASLPKLLADKDGDGVPDILRPPPGAGPAAALLLAVAIAIPSSGCVTARDTARTIVYGAAEAVDAADAVEAPVYAEAHARALAAATTLDEYFAAMAPHNGIEEALRHAREVIAIARAIVNAWDAGGSERWLAAAGCIADAIGRVVALLEAAGVRVPPEIGGALATVASVGAATCTGGA